MKATKTYEIPAVIDKSDIPVLAKQKGLANAGPLVLPGVTQNFAALSLVFLGQKMRIDLKDKKYKGVLVFGNADPNLTYSTFTTLPGLVAKGSTANAPAKARDVQQRKDS